jgi:hypothetical protein
MRREGAAPEAAAGPTLLPADRGTPRETLRESELAAAWQRQGFARNALATVSGEPLRVVYRGRPGLGPGPDFRDAIVVFQGSGPAHGDVELHVRTSDFQRHGHHLDPAYSGVILHVVFHDDAGCDTALRGGGRAPVLALGPVLAAGRVTRKPAVEPCRSAVDRIGTAATGAALDTLGSMRFRQKVAAWRRRLKGVDPEQALWEGLLESLAYGGNRALFRLVAQAVPWNVAPELAHRGVLGDELARACASPAPANSHRRNTRPGNSPAVRAAGAAALAARFVARGGIGAALLVPLAREDGVAVLLRTLTVPSLVGRARAIETAANGVLPIAAALCGGDRFEAMHASLPLPARYGSVRHLHEAMGGDVPLDTRRQQGMLYLLRQYCTQGGCGRCPLS